MNVEGLTTFGIAASGMRAQGERVRIIAENIANAETAPETLGGDPYRRKTISFKNVFDKELGAHKVVVSKIGQDNKAGFKLKYAPDSPVADETGYVKMPNVDTILEIMDMREAQRSYEANLGMLDMSRNMMARAVDLLR